MIIRVALIGLLMVASTSSAPQRNAKDDEDNFKMIILHNNDMHARFEQTSMISGKCKKEDADSKKCYGGFARVAHEVREFRRRAEAKEIPDVLYLNAGDTYTGTPWFSLYKDNITSDFLNILRPDAIVRIFLRDSSRRSLMFRLIFQSLGNHEFDEGSENLAKFLREINFPVLAANLILDDEPELKTATSMQPSIVFNVTGRQVGIIGYLTPETKDVAVPNKVEFIDEVVALK